MSELFSVFLNVILPVFGIVLIGALTGKRLELQAQTLTRSAYYIFIPAFIFQAISAAELPLTSTLRMIVFYRRDSSRRSSYCRVDRPYARAFAADDRCFCHDCRFRQYR